MSTSPKPTRSLHASRRELVVAGMPDDKLARVVGLSSSSLLDAAYRFARHEPGSDVVLFGTSSQAHLATNVASITAPPLPAADVDRLYQLFGALRGVGLDLPDSAKAQGKTGPS